MKRTARSAVTGEVLFESTNEVEFYCWLENHDEYRGVNVSYEVAPAFRVSYLSRAERHETWLMPQ